MIELGGADTMWRSRAAARFGGLVVAIGGLTGFAGATVAPGALIGGNETLAGVMVGSRAMTEQVVRFVERRAIRPVIGRAFAFGDAAATCAHLEAGRAFAKVVIEVG